MAEERYLDYHEEIGSFEIKSTREKLVECKPQELKEEYLSTGKDENALFAMPDGNWTKEKLNQAMQEQREYYLPFFADYAPTIENTRTHKELVEFQWRIGTEEDASDLYRVLKGHGEWELVKIPHYGPPLGYAVTYYRTEFFLDQEDMAMDSHWICFKGVDYKAQVYVNDVLVGSHEGFFAPFECDFTKQAKAGRNICVVVVENDFIPMGSNNEYRGTVYTGDKVYAQTGVGYDEPLVGWHHCPAGMGIWQDVYIESRRDFFIQDIFVRPLDYEKAEVWLELYGVKVGLRSLTVDLSVYGQNFVETVFEHKVHKPTTLSFQNKEKISLQMERGINYLKIPIEIPKARLWEPKNPWLYQIQVRLRDEKEAVLDCQKRQFGMRLITMDTDCSPKGVFRLNGKKIRFRGVNSQGREQRRVFMKDLEGLFQDYLLAKVGNINYLRITQRPVQPEVYDCCDKMGLLVQTDFPAYGSMRRNKITECLKQAQEMEHLIRNHPCCVVSTYINEPFPNAQNRPHRCVERHEMEYFFACADMMIHMLNPDRIIKPVDGDYDPPSGYGLPDYHCYTCWYNGHGIDLGRLHKGYWMDVKEDWNFGCGEYGMEGLDSIEVIKKYYPKEWLPKHDDDTWTPADIPGDPPPQLGHLHYMLYETPRTMEEWVEASQLYQAQVMNLMTRAYRRNPQMVSYAYHLFIDAYPDGWMKAMVDVDRTPKKAFWEYRNACNPIMMDLRYDRFKVFDDETINVECRICNDPDEILQDAKMHYQVFLEEELLLAGTKELCVPACDVEFQGFIPISLPKVQDRSKLKIQAAVIRNNGDMLDSYELQIEVFHRTKTALGKVCILGTSDVFVDKFTAEFDVKNVSIDEIDSETAVLIGDYEKYREVENAILKAVEQGAKLLLMRLPCGGNLVANQEIFVKTCENGPVHFVSRNREHFITKDFETDDVRYWYDESIGCLSPILLETLEAEGYDSILTSAAQDDNEEMVDVGKWKVVPAVARRELGKGSITICQIDLQNRIITNPTAKILLERLLCM